MYTQGDLVKRAPKIRFILNCIQLPLGKTAGTTLSLAITPISMTRKAPIEESSAEKLMADLASLEERQQGEGTNRILSDIPLPLTQSPEDKAVVIEETPSPAEPQQPTGGNQEIPKHCPKGGTVGS